MTSASLIERKLIQADQSAKEDAIRFARASQERKKSELQLHAARERFWGDVARIAQSAVQPSRAGAPQGGKLRVLEESRRLLSEATKQHKGALKTLHETGRTFDRSTAMVKALKQEVSTQRARRETARTNRTDEEMIGMALARSVQAGRAGIKPASRAESGSQGFGSAKPVDNSGAVVRREQRSQVEGDKNGKTESHPYLEIQRAEPQATALMRSESTQFLQIKETHEVGCIPSISSVQAVADGLAPVLRLTCRLPAGYTVGVEVAASNGAAPRIAITSGASALHAVLERERPRILEQLKEAGVQVASIAVKNGPVESEVPQSYSRSRRRFGDDHERVGT